MRGMAVVNQDREDTCGINCEDERRLEDARGPKDPRPERRTHLEDQQEEEVGIGQSAELLQEVQRQEGEQVVLGRLDGVVLKHTGR